MSTDLRRNNHSVSKLLVHLVFVVKYRRSAITESVWKSLQYGFGLAARPTDGAEPQARTMETVNLQPTPELSYRRWTRR